MSIHKLMGNPAAQNKYLAIDPMAVPLDLADDYKLAKLADDKPGMIAIEEHMRQLAQIHFQRDDVREALRQVEVYKFKRRPGKGGNKAMQAIATSIEDDYAAGRYESVEGKARFAIGALRLSCVDRPGAVAWMAAKYRRGYRR